MTKRIEGKRPVIEKPRATKKKKASAPTLEGATELLLLGEILFVL